jgi:hypothetical protein
MSMINRQKTKAKNQNPKPLPLDVTLDFEFWFLAFGSCPAVTRTSKPMLDFALTS